MKLKAFAASTMRTCRLRLRIRVDIVVDIVVRVRFRVQGSGWAN